MTPFFGSVSGNVAGNVGNVSGNVGSVIFVAVGVLTNGHEIKAGD